eukprot:442609_1
MPAYISAFVRIWIATFTSGWMLHWGDFWGDTINEALNTTHIAGRSISVATISDAESITAIHLTFSDWDDFDSLRLETANFDLEEMGLFLQPYVDSKVEYYMINMLYSNDTINLHQVNHDSSFMPYYVGHLGDMYAQNWSSEAMGDLTCDAQVYISCFLTSDVQSNIQGNGDSYDHDNSWDYRQLFEEYILQNGKWRQASQGQFYDYSGTIYRENTFILSQYESFSGYLSDHLLNNEFTFNGIELRWYDNVPRMGNVTINCTAAVTSCDDASKCSIVFPWCGQPATTDHDDDNINESTYYKLMVLMIFSFIINLYQ